MNKKKWYGIKNKKTGIALGFTNDVYLDEDGPAVDVIFEIDMPDNI